MTVTVALVDIEVKVLMPRVQYRNSNKSESHDSYSHEGKG